MLFSYAILALSVSIDSLGIGITYGLKNTIIANIAKIILFAISFVMTTLAITIGDILSSFLPNFMTKLIGSSILVFMGSWIIFQALSRKEQNGVCRKNSFEPKVHQFFIKFLGITIQIIRNPISSDLDCSKKIDWKEAIYLGIALSIDSLCVGIGGSIIGLSSALFPLLVATFQLIFLSAGKFIGSKVVSTSQVPSNTWNVISGLLLICIGFVKIFM